MIKERLNMMVVVDLLHVLLVVGKLPLEIKISVYNYPDDEESSTGIRLASSPLPSLFASPKVSHFSY